MLELLKNGLVVRFIRSNILKKLVGIYKMCRGCKNLIVVPKKWTNNTGGYYNNITVQFVMEVS